MDPTFFVHVEPKVQYICPLAGRRRAAVMTYQVMGEGVRGVSTWGGIWITKASRSSKLFCDPRDLPTSMTHPLPQHITQMLMPTLIPATSPLAKGCVRGKGWLEAE